MTIIRACPSCCGKPPFECQSCDVERIDITIRFSFRTLAGEVVCPLTDFSTILVAEPIESLLCPIIGNAVCLWDNRHETGAPEICSGTCELPYLFVVLMGGFTFIQIWPWVSIADNVALPAAIVGQGAWAGGCIAPQSIPGVKDFARRFHCDPCGPFNPPSQYVKYIEVLNLTPLP